MKGNEASFFLGFGVLLASVPAFADATPPGFVEPIVQWGVQKNQTCEDIAKTLYGSAVHVPLIGRYNRVVCAAGKPLPEGSTLILPATVTQLPDARVKSSHPAVRGRPSGGSWAIVDSGAPLYRNHNVQTMEEGRAHIVFLDQTHVFLAQNTLIVVYGTAAKTSVSKVAPTVELQSGEVQAGLSALRGEPALVAVPEGGQVSASSKDTVVERKATRTTVAVFEGKASVESGGKAVTVPKNFGTRFVGAAPPVPPRPLPPAPHWQMGGSPSIVLAPKGEAKLTASWTAVDKAKAYRFEVSHDDGFHDLAGRYEIGAEINTYRGEAVPPGTYRLRVRAIDTEEYLGIASEVRVIEVIEANVKGEGSRLEGGKVVANPYDVLTFGTQPGLEIALDDGPFGAIPKEIDLLHQAPKAMRIRTPSGRVEPISVEYTTVTARPTESFDADKRIVNIQVAMEGSRGIDIVQRIGPQLRVRFGDRVESVPLALQPDQTLRGSFAVGDAAGEARFDVADARGRLLGASTFLVPEKPAPAPPSPRPVPRIGLKLPPIRPAGVTGFYWSSPTAPISAGIGIGAGQTAHGPVFQGNVRASGSIGAWGFDALVESPPYESTTNQSPDAPPTENRAWLGTRYRAIRRGDVQLEVAPMFRIGVPMVWSGQPLRFDVGGALGGHQGRWTWLVNAGGMFAAGGNVPIIPRFAPYAVAGGTFDAFDWFRAYAAVDVHLLIAADERDVVPFGFSGGIELGRDYFATLGGWVGRAESVAWTWGATGMLSLGIHTGEVTR